MGGRGSAGASGSSTIAAGERLANNGRLDTSLFSGRQGGSAGQVRQESSAGSSKKTQSTGAASGKGGAESSSSTSSISERDVVVQKAKIPADADLDLIFENSSFFDELVNKYPGDVQFRRNYPVYFQRWRATVDVEESAAPEANSPWLESLPKSDVDIVGLSEMFDNAEKVNRPYLKSKDHRINCQRCAAAVELNARGYDVKAAPISEGWKPRIYNPETRQYEGETASFSEIARMWRDKDGHAGEWFWRRDRNGNRDAVVNALEQEILSWGEGARGFVGVNWSSNSAHIFNVEVRDGRIVYIDAQPTKASPTTGSQVLFDSDTWKDKIDPKLSQGVMRVDNLNPVEDVTTWVKPRNEKESNFLNLSDFSDEFFSRSETGWLWDIELTDDLLNEFSEDDLFMAFYFGWESVWRGEVNPLPPAPIRGEPILVKLFEKGLELAEVPV